MARVTGRQTLRGNAPAVSPREYFKRNVTIPLLDQLVTEVSERFGDLQLRALKAMKLVPSVIADSAWVETESLVKELDKEYHDDLPAHIGFGGEIHAWRIYWKETKFGERSEDSDKGNLPCKERDYPNLKVILRILCTLPVTSCECERSFSLLRRLKTYLRSTMSEERLNGLAMMAIHKNHQLNVEHVIDIYAHKHARRIRLKTVSD